MTSFLLGNRLVKSISEYTEKVHTHIKDHIMIQNFLGLSITFSYAFGYLNLNTLISMLYFSLFMFTCREILHYHTLNISGSTQTIDLMNLVQYWVGLYAYYFSYNLLIVIFGYLGSLLLTVLINGLFFSILLYALQDLFVEFTAVPLPKLTYVKRVDLYEGTKNPTTVTKLVNSSVNFYRVNMKFYDHVFLSVCPNMFYTVFMIAYESYGFSTNFVLSSYYQVKSVMESIRDKYIGTGDPEHVPENVLVRSQHIDSKENNEETVVNLVSSIENNNIELTKVPEVVENSDNHTDESFSTTSKKDD